jgi:tetratricopeptide (TPR) repeat protein
MSDSNSSATREDQPATRRLSVIIACVVFGLAAGITMWMADPNAALELNGSNANGSYYNLLVDGFRAGRLNVNREPPPQLAQVSDPYNPALNSAVVGPLNDLSYYKGKLYLYFGVTPALVLYWPWVALTGHYASDRAAVAVFFAVGMAVMAGLLGGIRRRYFSKTGAWTVAASVTSILLMLGLALSGGVYAVAAVCGFAFVMLAMAAVWRALHEPRQRTIWLAFASLACGLAIGARPTLLFSMVILLVPAAHMCRKMAGSPAKAGWLLAAAAAPAMFVAFGLMLYNDLRFANPFEFGWHYQLNRDYDPTKARQFGLHYFWYNFRSYFLEPFECRNRFPFLDSAPPVNMPAGYDPGSTGVGGAIWCRYPLAWLALALPTVWIGRERGIVLPLHRFTAALLLFFLSTAFILCLFFTASGRYEFDFLPALLMLAVIGFFAAERAAEGAPGWRSALRALGSFLLVSSIAVSVLGNVEAHAVTHYFRGNMFLSADQSNEAIIEYQKALALWPDCLSARDGLGNVLLKEGRPDQAIVQYQKEIELQPQSAGARERYGDALFQKGRLSEAERQYQKAIELKPDFAQAHENLGTCFAKTGQLDQAIVQYQQAIKLQPDFIGPYYSLGNVLRLKGMAAEAITNYRKAIELQPAFIPAQVNLAEILATSHDPAIRDVPRAVALMENANRVTAGKDLLVLRALATAYAEAGRFSEAVTAANKALAIATAGSDVELIKKLHSQIRLYEAGSTNNSGD